MIGDSGLGRSSALPFRVISLEAGVLQTPLVSRRPQSYNLGDRLSYRNPWFNCPSIEEKASEKKKNYLGSYPANAVF